MINDRAIAIDMACRVAGGAEMQAVPACPLAEGTAGSQSPGAFQAVEIRAPDGVAVCLAANSSFQSTQATPLRVGMLVGPLYRIRVTNIPFSAGVEVFPTVELVDRTYAPSGEQLRFAIPVELTAEDLQAAADGKFITRVIYVEDPHTAVPAVGDREQQSCFDVAAGQNPLAVARQLGRPVAVLRLGGRVPLENDLLDTAFLCGCPPFVNFGTAGATRKQNDQGEQHEQHQRPAPSNGVKVLPPPPKRTRQ